MKTILKTLGFIAVIGVYYFVAGTPAWHTNYGIKLAVIYQFGAVIAFWLGDKRIGTLDPISLRPIFIALGVILMVAMFVLMFQTRDTAGQLLEIHGRAPKPPKDLGPTTNSSRLFFLAQVASPVPGMALAGRL